MDEAGDSQRPLGAAAPGSPRRVFISYASPDAAVAQRVCSALEAAGITCWIAPRDVVPGTLYAEGIVRALDESRIFVLILSERAVASAHVGRELERAASKRHPIIALRIDGAPLTGAFEYFLNQSQWIEAAADSDRAIGQLVEAVGRHLSPGSPSSQAAHAPIVGRRSAGPQRSWVLAGAVIALVLAAGYLAADKGWLSKRVAAKNEAPATPAVISDKSIAVLPFVDMSEKKDQEYFADGLSEELIDLLTKVPALKVPARTSSFYFKGKQTTMGDIAKALGVTHVLEGSVRKSGHQLRITAQLIRVDSGYHVWSETYDRNDGDIFQIQDDISNAVVSALKASLGAPASIPSYGTSNADAYDLFLRAGSSYQLSTTKEDYQKVVDELQQAIRMDPSFARAWASLSSTLSTMAGYEFNEPTQGFEDARHAALKALELDPNEPDAHRALARIAYLHDWNWAVAEAHIQQALSVRPSDPKNLIVAGIVPSILGHPLEALQYSKKAIEKDPLNFDNFDIFGFDAMMAGDLRAAQQAFRRAQALRPSYQDAHWKLGLALLLDGKTLEALAEFERESDDEDRLGGRALAYHALGRTAEAGEAQRDLGSLVEKNQRGFIAMAQVYAYRGDRDRAFTWLARACQRRETDCAFVKADPLLKNLDGDARYKAFLRKMNLPE